MENNDPESKTRMGNGLIEKIKTINPEMLITDCLSCRLQFNQLTSYKVLHPLEILKQSYTADFANNDNG